MKIKILIKNKTFDQKKTILVKKILLVKNKNFVQK